MLPIEIDENELSRGLQRKLKALRRSLGADLGDRAFAEWYGQQEFSKPDPVATAIARRIMELIIAEGLILQRGGYIVRRGHGRVIVEPVRRGKKIETLDE